MLAGSGDVLRDSFRTESVGLGGRARGRCGGELEHLAPWY